MSGGYVNYMQADEPIERVRAAFGERDVRAPPVAEGTLRPRQRPPPQSEHPAALATLHCMPGGPRQNRVDPFGRLIAAAARGALMGNRGCLHDARGRIRRSHRGTRVDSAGSSSGAGAGS